MSMDDERRKRDEGFRRALGPMSPTLKEAIFLVIDSLAETGEPFTADDVRQTLLQYDGFKKDLEKWPNVGGLFGAKSRNGVIKHAGLPPRATSLEGGHARPYPVWIGV